MLIASLVVFAALAALLLYATRGKVRIAAVGLCAVGACAVGWSFVEHRTEERARTEKVGSMCHSLAHWLEATAEMYDRNNYEPAKYMLDGIRRLLSSAGALCVPDPDACNVMIGQGELGTVPTPAHVKPVADALRARRACRVN